MNPYVIIGLTHLIYLLHNLQNFYISNFIFYFKFYTMIYSTYLFPLIHVSNNFKLSTDITQIIYFYIINSFTQCIIDKWYSFINIHNTNLCYLVNKINLLQGYTLFGDTISYYDLHDKKLNITLSICAKYIKPSISDKNWWRNFIQYGFNGLIFINDDTDHIVSSNLYFLNNIFGCFH